MGKWEMVAFDDVLIIINGKNQKQVENPSGKYPIYGSGGIMGYADEFLCKKDTVVIGRKGTINRPIFVQEPFWNVDTAFGLYANTLRLYPKYLYYFCQQFNFETLNTTVTIPSLTKANLLKVQIPLPPLPVQKKIAAVLDKASVLIEKRKAQIEKLDLLVKAQFIEMFSDPVTNPKGWDIEKLSAMGDINRGVSKHRPRNDPKLLGGEYPLVQTGDVANAGLYIFNYSSTYSELGLAQSRMWKKDTLCITIAANIAKTGILGFNACFPDSVVGFLPNEKTNIFFINYWFTFFQKILEEQAPESAQKNINLRILYALNVICPPIELQDQFATFVQQVEAQKTVLQQSLTKLELNYKSLMQKCFRGEVF